jgi:hypothetical protein
MKTINAVKFEGARHLRKMLRDRPVSPLGVKVANVLGQVWKGIYHLEMEHSPSANKIDWGADDQISVTVTGDLATFDGCLLTMLCLCCNEAKLNLFLAGSFSGYTRLIFRENHAVDLSKIKLDGNLIEYADPCLDAVKKFSDSERLLFSLPILSWQNLNTLIHAAHRDCVRASVIGRSPRSLELRLSQRTREGSMWARHPTLEDHKKMLAPYVEVDYSSIN